VIGNLSAECKQKTPAESGVAGACGGPS